MGDIALAIVIVVTQSFEIDQIEVVLSNCM